MSEKSPTAPALLLTTRGKPWSAFPRIGERFLKRHGKVFATQALALQYLNYIFTPVDGRWAFKPNSKAGMTSVLEFLFTLEFGHPLSAKLQAIAGPTLDGDAYHALPSARVFSFLLERGDDQNPLAYLRKSLRLTTVRHPLDRTVSGFLYLCRSNDLGAEQFFANRARLCALTGFDWETHPRTAGGFERFLDYVQMELAHDGDLVLDSHFRPQVMNIRPEIFEPELIGRCEDLPRFFREIAERLDRPIPQGALDRAPRNQQADSARETLVRETARQKVEDIFAADFETFDYDPAHSGV